MKKFSFKTAMNYCFKNWSSEELNNFYFYSESNDNIVIKLVIREGGIFTGTNLTPKDIESIKDFILVKR